MPHTPKLFQPATFRSVTTRNRIVVAPMCQYTAEDGLGGDWHLQTLGAKAFGGAGIVFTEATHVSAIGRITPGCLGLWNEAQAKLLARVTALISAAGAVPGIQIAHAGRKAGTARPWEGGKPVPISAGGWQPVGASPLAYDEGYAVPTMLSTADIAGVVEQFATTARFALESGFKIIELHAAHGYLLHSFLSPLSNQRNDAYGGELTGRAHLLMQIIEATRAVWPSELPLFIRISCTDWAPGGVTIEDSVALCKMLAARGDVDLIDCSSGGNVPYQTIPSLHPGYQVPFADRIKHDAGIATGAVGLITAPAHAEEILGNDRADLVFLARVLLADPAWPLRAAVALGMKPEVPPQYLRANLAFA
jgi:2,4-dienoyl-CoA reductase-like NADH-dependent reductase (Old Yellow Enzyme family)